MKFHDSILAAEIHDRAAALIQRHLKFKDYHQRCLKSVIIDVLLFAACRITSVSDASRCLKTGSSDETFRKALLATLPTVARLERQINAALTGDLPKALRKQRQLVAIDYHEVPYHGQPLKDYWEVCRFKPREGTTHFHTYATAHVVHKGRRFTLALTWVRQNDTMEEVLQRLLHQVHACGVKVRILLLDRGFFSVNVIRYLQAARIPFLMPLKAAGRKPKDPDRAASGARRFFQWKRSGWGQHSWRNRQGRLATVLVCVSCRNTAGRYKKHRRQALVYAYWGFQPGSTRWVRDTYRKRFAIEASYRQLKQARIRSSTRDPLRRLLYVGIALILRNVWVWIHFLHLGEQHGRHITVELFVLRFRTLLLILQRFVNQAFATQPPNRP